jgi:hypothetical protein
MIADFEVFAHVMGVSGGQLTGPKVTFAEAKHPEGSQH